ncbi:MAG: DoxX family protein [Acidobacteria bacterium]|nr:DoxX family protein [Acidobacteriota bacterium]
MSAESHAGRDRLLYRIFTGLLAAQMLLSAGIYLFNNEMARDAFTNLGYPTHIIYPLAAAKLLGLVAVVSNWSRPLKDMAYAGFFFNLVLAVMAHLSIGDGVETSAAALALVWLSGSVWFDRKLHSRPA